MFGNSSWSRCRYILIVSLVFLLIHCFSCTSIVRGENIVGYVSEVRGSAVISRETQKAILQNLNVNNLIFVSSLITVYQDAVVVISLREGSIVEIGENSEFNFRKVSELEKTRKFQYEFRLNSGKVNLIFNSRVAKATLRTDDLALMTQSESIIQISKDTKGTSLGNAVSDIRVTNEKGSLVLTPEKYISEATAYENLENFVKDRQSVIIATANKNALDLQKGEKQSLLVAFQLRNSETKMNIVRSLPYRMYSDTYLIRPPFQTLNFNERGYAFFSVFIPLRKIAEISQIPETFKLFILPTDTYEFIPTVFQSDIIAPASE